MRRSRFDHVIVVVVAQLLLAAGVARADASVAGGDNCAAHPLRFAPTPGLRYLVSTWDGAAPGDFDAAYHSMIVFSRRAPSGWTAQESGLRRPHLTTSASGMSSTLLTWRLDERGLPVDVPTLSGSGDPVIARNLSLFAFRPLGLVAPSGCVGARGQSRFTDAAGRTREYELNVTAVNGASVTVSVDGGVQIANGKRWLLKGEISIDRADGLTGTARLRVDISATPHLERQRTVVIAREEKAPPLEPASR
jgi:hypothetical protein